MKKILAFAALLAAATSANASITVVLDGMTPSGSNVAYNYTMQQTTDDTLFTGDYFTIYDFRGFVSATAAAGFAASTQNTGITPVSQIITDDPSIVNVTFTASAPNNSTSISGFSIVSSLTTPAVFDDFAGRNHKDSGSANEANGEVLVPGNPVPEPATMGLMGGALLGLGLLARRRK
jgi:hypothetical protein